MGAANEWMGSKRKGEARGMDTLELADLAETLDYCVAVKRCRTEQMTADLQSLRLNNSSTPETQNWWLTATCKHRGSTLSTSRSRSVSVEDYMIPISSGRYGSSGNVWHAPTLSMNHDCMTRQAVSRLHAEQPAERHRIEEAHFTLSSFSGAMVPYTPPVEPEQVVAAAATNHVRAHLRRLLADRTESAESTRMAEKRRIKQLEKMTCSNERGKKSIDQLLKEGSRTDHAHGHDISYDGDVSDAGEMMDL